MSEDIRKVVLVTGAARRLGAAMVRHLHSQMNIVLHYRSSTDSAQALYEELTEKRADSVQLVQADLADMAQLDKVVDAAISRWGRLDVLINNASSFYPTPLAAADVAAWDDLFASNAKAPFFLSQLAFPYLEKVEGCIINMADIHGQRPMRDYSIYCMAKAALLMMTKALAKEFAPHVRVNAIAPGPVLWPEHSAELSNAVKAAILNRTPLQREGSAAAIVKAVNFLICTAEYTTGHILTVDGGRSLS